MGNPVPQDIRLYNILGKVRQTKLKNKKFTRKKQKNLQKKIERKNEQKLTEQLSFHIRNFLFYFFSSVSFPSSDEHETIRVMNPIYIHIRHSHVQDHQNISINPDTV